MKTIWKFSCSLLDTFTLYLPEDAEILSVQAQQDDAVLHAMVEPDAIRTERRFRLFETGSKVNHETGHMISGADSLKYVGTFQTAGGFYVWHLFEDVSHENQLAT